MDFENMNDQELKEAYERQVQIDYLKEREAKKYKATAGIIALCIVGGIILLAIVACTVIMFTCQPLTVDLDGDGYYEIIRVPFFLVDYMKANFSVLN